MGLLRKLLEQELHALNYKRKKKLALTVQWNGANGESVLMEQDQDLKLSLRKLLVSVLNVQNFSVNQKTVSTVLLHGENLENVLAESEQDLKSLCKKLSEQEP